MARRKLTGAELRARGIAPGDPHFSRYKDRLSDPNTATAPTQPFRALSKTPPTHLTPKQKQLWKSVLSMVPKGVLSRSHAVVVEIACTLWEKVILGTAKPSEVKELRSILLSFEMTPTRRAPAQPVQQETNEFDLLSAIKAEHDSR
jgi:hypothetical protein